MRQKLRKYLKDFEDDIVKFREDPEKPDSEEEEDNSKFFFVLFKINIC